MMSRGLGHDEASYPSANDMDVRNAWKIFVNGVQDQRLASAREGIASDVPEAFGTDASVIRTAREGDNSRQE
jgi:hypothetical protein